jgi:aryl-alcohol dehydrogenase-like predicted oxidoreductase
METRYLGNDKLPVSAIGLGCWGMSNAYGQATRTESIATIREAFEQGVTFFDTADIYGNGHNEQLLGDAVQEFRQQVVIASKFGFRNSEQEKIEVCGEPEYVKEACHASLKRLNTDYIDLYYLHRLDKNVPVEETVSAMARLVHEGKVRYLGLSEVAADTIRRANKIHPLTAIQSEYSLITRNVEEKVLPICKQLDIGFIPFSPLGRGLLTGKIRTRGDLAENDYRNDLPRFQEENLSKNVLAIDKITELANSQQVTPSQIALAWLMHQGDYIVPIPGMKNRSHLISNINATEIHLSHEELERLNKIASQIHGDRYQKKNKTFLDEKLK